jgi:integrase
MPLVGYFTGARTNEIAQLDTADIKEIDGHTCFDFCADDPKAPEAKRIKADEARQVPIHPRLIELGFLEYVVNQRRANQKKLFGDGLTYLPARNDGTDHNKEGWAKSAGKFFNEKPKGYLVAIGVHVPNDGKSLYSFRHTLETNLCNAKRDGKDVDQSIIDAIVGHAPETIAGKHYDGGPTIGQMLSALQLLPIPKAIQQLTSYQINFIERFGETLAKSISSHQRKHPRLACSKP